MRLKFSLLYVALLAMSVHSGAQTARNPLNHEPARVKFQRSISSERLSEEVFYHADGSQFDKSSFVYDEDGRKKTEIFQRWNDDERTWQNVSQCNSVYEGNKEIAISSDWDMTTWKNASKVESVYDLKGNILYTLSYSWNDRADDWNTEPSMKNEWVYDENGRVTEYLKQSMNRETAVWNDYHARILYTYDGDGELSEEVYMSWNPENKSWTDRGKYSYSKEDQIHRVATSYIYASGKWVYDGKIIHIYDQEEKVIRSEYYGNILDNSLKAYCIYTYSDKLDSPEVIVTGNISVYPNPVVSSFELTVPEMFVGKTADIFDIYGRPVKTILVNNEKMQIDATGLSSGIYILKVGDKNAKFVIRRN